jgi:hypothetical protein
MDVVMVKDFGPLINLAATATKLEKKRQEEKASKEKASQEEAKKRARTPVGEKAQRLLLERKAGASTAPAADCFGGPPPPLRSMPLCAGRIFWWHSLLHAILRWARTLAVVAPHIHPCADRHAHAAAHDRKIKNLEKNMDKYMEQASKKVGAGLGLKAVFITFGTSGCRHGCSCSAFSAACMTAA